MWAALTSSLLYLVANKLVVGNREPKDAVSGRYLRTAEWRCVSPLEQMVFICDFSTVDVKARRAAKR
jgi:hypothetical protein